MNRRASLTLIFVPAVLFGLLLFLSPTTPVSGRELDGRAFSLSNAPLLQGGNETEPNDTIDTADRIDVNLTIAGAIPLVQTSDIDWYRLVLAGSDVGRDFRAVLEELDSQTEYRLELNLYNAEGSLVSTVSGASSSSLDWTSDVITYYLRVRATEFNTSVAQDADYGLTVLRFASDPTQTPTATPVPWDDCEINDDINGTWSDDTPPGGPCLLSVGVKREDLNFVPYTGQPAPNDDFFTFLAKAGRTYRIQTTVHGGADTIMTLYDPSGTPIVTDDDGGVDTGSLIERALSDGWYKILVRDRLGSGSPSSSQTYDIIVEDVTDPTPTPTPTPLPGTGTPTPKPPTIPGAPDKYEPNFAFDRATLIGLDEQVGANFVPWSGTNPDTDFYKLWVTAGNLYTCETNQLGSATNTNIIFCRVPPGETPPGVVNNEILSRMCFAGNDDVLPFDPSDPYRSRLKFFSSYNDYLYVVLGQVGADRVLPEEWQNLSYNLKCYIELPGTATPTPTSEFAPPTPAPPTAPSVQNTSAPPPPSQLAVSVMQTPVPPPIPTPIPTPTPLLYTINVLLYYDRNNNGQIDPGEGIPSALARTYDAVSGELLSIDYSDETGAIRFVLPARGPVRVSVPFFGFNQLVAATNADIQIRIAPRP